MYCWYTFGDGAAAAAGMPVTRHRRRRRERKRAGQIIIAERRGRCRNEPLRSRPSPRKPEVQTASEQSTPTRHLCRARAETRGETWLWNWHFCKRMESAPVRSQQYHQRQQAGTQSATGSSGQLACGSVQQRSFIQSIGSMHLVCSSLKRTG